MKRLWNISLVAKVFLSYFAVVALLFTGFYLFSNKLVRDFHIATLSRGMDQEIQLLSRILPFDLEGVAMDALCRQLAGELGSRITIIAVDGKVLGDSAEASATMDNHGVRPEVIGAKSSGSGSSIRYSTTVGYDMLYRAFRQTGAGQERIVRLATPLRNIESVVRSFRQSLLTGLITASAAGLLLAWALSRYLSRRIQRLVHFSAQVTSASIAEESYPNRGGDEIARLERHLNEMNQKLRADIQQITGEKDKTDSILRCMIEGVLVLDPRGKVLAMNEQARRMFHVPEGRDTQGISILEISRHPEIHRVLKEVMSFDFNKQPYSKEVEIEEDRCFRVNAVMLRDSQGKSLGSILVFHDITDLKRYESIRSDFVANVSHELRTPLTAIRGYVETLLHTPPANPEDSRQFLEIIHRHSERLSRLTEDLLTLSDLESGNIKLALHPIDAGHVIQRVLEVFWDRASKKGIDLSQQVAPGLPKLLGDSDRLQQLFINLIDNAIKYTPPGGAVTLVAIESPSNGGASHVEISVSDTGPGIPEKDLPRLTERFYRVDKARSRDLGGTGLGLAIVKHIVQAHKGELKIDSVLNSGTTVRVRLPIAPVALTHSSILFLTTANSCRSQMAEGFARNMASGAQQVFSAGTAPRAIHPLAIRVMGEVGIDISTQRSKGLEEIPLDQIDQLITLSGEVFDISLALPVRVVRTHWPLPDPALAAGDDEEIMRVFREVRDEIQARVQALLSAPQRHAA